MDINKRFEVMDDEYLKFERIENKRTQRPDLHAFLLLDEIFPGTTDIVACAEHDEIWLKSEGRLDLLSDEQILELVRCGVRYDDDCESLTMFA
jgi:hypothetical protein